VAALHARKTELYVERTPHLALRPGIERLMHEARGAGIKLGIATTTSLPNIEIL